MNQDLLDSARRVARRFEISGDLLEIVPFRRGHIHDTFVSTWKQPHGVRRFLHQHMNDRVFRDIPRLMRNIEHVTSHLVERLEREQSVSGFHPLSLVRTREGAGYVSDESGPWRTYDFIERTDSFDQCTGPKQARETARAFGRFQAWLADMDLGELQETIPRFFSSPHRFAQFQDARQRDPHDRVAQARAEIEFALERESAVSVMEDGLACGRFPLRIVHGDTKLNNVLFDVDSGKAVSIVDLDTCMPGWSLYDFGDLVRFTAATCREDEPDVSRAGVDAELYRALQQGYLEEAGSFLTAEEIELMPFSARLVTLTVGLRFLADFLEGDVYFKVDRPAHNLDRAKVQFRMVEELERMLPESTRPDRSEQAEA